MARANFWFWPTQDTNDNFAGTAADAINNDLDPQLNVSVEGNDNSSQTQFDGAGYSNWGSLLADFEQHVIDEVGHPGDDDCHIVLVDRPFGTLGAGKNPTQLGKGTSYPNSSSKGAAGGVNVAVKTAGPACYNYGGPIYRSTVIHECLHSLLDEPDNTFPSDFCTDSVDNEHSAGEINNAYVSPMQLFYTSQVCDSNPTPCNNCSTNPDAYVQGSTSDISDCTKTQAEDYVDKYL